MWEYLCCNVWLGWTSFPAGNALFNVAKLARLLVHVSLAGFHKVSMSGQSAHSVRWSWSKTTVGKFYPGSNALLDLDVWCHHHNQ
ncbi:hypothetical protein F5X99DRAFT_372790 [Biscogniauxia marginata]|nr:hypothetical protein F5X99DRAFT_372790 [Biscogniauxia marginata]